MKSPLTLLLLLSLTLGLSAQSYQQIIGKIIDQNSQEPLAYVHIGMPTQGIGAISNEEGVFNFSFPNYLQKEPIIISHIGYEEYRLQATEISRDSITIRLIPVSQKIAEVEVLSTSAPLESYVEEAFKRFKENYPQNPFQLSGFYRSLKINAEDQSHTRLLEAAVRLQDKGYQHKTDLIRWELTALRKSDDQTNYHPDKIKWDLKSKRLNNMMTMFSWTIRNYLPRKKRRAELGLVSDPPKEKKVTLKDVTYLGDEKIYVIEFDRIAKNTVYYISAEDFGIHRIEQSWYFGTRPRNAPDTVRAKRFKSKTITLDGYGFVNYNMQFRKINGKYHLIYLQEISIGDPVQNTTPTVDNKAYSYDIHTLFINEVLASKKQFKKIKGRNMTDEEIDLYYHELPYDPKFWKNYPLLAQNPLEQRVIEDLTSDSSLEEQFKRNGSKEK